MTVPVWLVMNGSTAAWTMHPAIAASIAVPPSASTFTIVSVTIGWSLLHAASSSVSTGLGPGLLI
ncbi:MAG: hypothetical protein WDN24_12225 [Sphingomonas sp.]